MNDPEPTRSTADPAPTTAPAVPPAVVTRRHTRLLWMGAALAALLALFWPRGIKGPAPGGFLVDGQGRPAPLAGQLAPVTLLHFWATWCPPCLEEVPAIDRLARELEQEDRFRVVMVAVADDPAKAREFAGASGERVLYDPSWEIAHRYGTRQLPETYLLVDGQVERKFVGATNWDDPQMRATVERAIAAARPAR